MVPEKVQCSRLTAATLRRIAGLLQIVWQEIQVREQVADAAGISHSTEDFAERLKQSFALPGIFAEPNNSNDLSVINECVYRTRQNAIQCGIQIFFEQSPLAPTLPQFEAAPDLPGLQRQQRLLLRADRRV